MQLNKPAKIGVSLATATCSLLGNAPNRAVAAQEEDNWETDTSLLYYGEQDRVQDASLAVMMRRLFQGEKTLSLGLTLDALTGATPSGAVPSSLAQTFTRPSGGSSYQVQPGETPLDDTFRDTRVALNAGWSQPLTDDMDGGIGITFSNEYDYVHAGINGRLAWNFNNNNTTLNLGAAYASDSLDPVGGAPIPLAPMRGEEDSTSKAGSDSKNVADLLIGVTQVINRKMLVQANYALSKADGYLNDPYKLVSVVDPVTGRSVAGPDAGLGLHLYESRPDTRTKHSLFFQTKYYAFDRDVIDASYRVMTDDWGIDSHTLDLRYRWNYSARSYLEPHLRFYTQGAADFYHTNLVDGDALPVNASADYRLAEFDAVTAGLKYGRFTPGGSEWSLRLEYYRQTGNASSPDAVGELLDYPLFPDLDAVIAQFSYRFKW